MATEPSPLKSHNKWIAGAIWLALLAALAYTSGNSITLSFGGSLSTYLRFLANPPASTDSQSASTILLAVGGLVVTIALVYQLLRAWLKFANVTHQLIISFAAVDRSDTADSIFYDMLEFQTVEVDGPGEDEVEPPAEPDPTDSDRSSVSDVVAALAYTWAIIIIAPPLISVVIVLFAKPTQ